MREVLKGKPDCAGLLEVRSSRRETISVKSEMRKICHLSGGMGDSYTNFAHSAVNVLSGNTEVEMETAEKQDRWIFAILKRRLWKMGTYRI